MSENGFLLTDDVAELLGLARSTVQEQMARGLVPNRRLPGTRRCVVPRADFDAWINGAELEVIHLARGGRIVRPIGGG
jgi:excisionase family DNA binding protein